MASCSIVTTIRKWYQAACNRDNERICGGSDDEIGMMKPFQSLVALILLCTGLSAGLAGCSQGPTMLADLTSNLKVPAHQQFRLGGGQPGEFFAEIVNEGSVPALVRVDSSGELRDLGVAQPGEKLRHRFAAGEGAIVVNRADTDASLKVRVWGDTQIAMRYTPAE
ncbi:MAG: hypothetical protein NTV94_10565 [Planctomycetota bacterium]|nr:hypothetical protein [Planctomycetota bacterium]